MLTVAAATTVLLVREQYPRAAGPGSIVTQNGARQAGKQRRPRRQLIL